MARHTLKSFCSSTESIRGTHRSQDGGIFTCYTSDKVLISETHEEIQKRKTKEIKLPVTRWTNGLNAVFKNMNTWPITTFKVFNLQSHQQMYIKTCLEMPPRLSEWLSLRSLTNVGENVGKKKLLLTADGCKSIVTVETILGFLKPELPHEPAIFLLCTLHTPSQRYLHPPVDCRFVTIRRKPIQPTCPPADEWILRIRYI